MLPGELKRLVTTVTVPHNYFYLDHGPEGFTQDLNVSALPWRAQMPLLSDGR